MSTILCIFACQAAKLAKLSQEVDALRAENSILRQSVLEADPEVSAAGPQ